MRSILAGTYLVGCVLGQGGFGITYIGLDLNLNLKVAIKEYYPEGCVTRDGRTHTSVVPLPAKRKRFSKKARKSSSAKRRFWQGLPTSRPLWAYAGSSTKTEPRIS